MTQPLLSICIPTYNREYLIGDCLGKICPSAAKYGVEVVVSDNASTDGTDAIIRDYASRYDNLVYVRQPENLGMDANIETVLCTATGKYRWLMGDACFVDEIPIERLLPYLKEDYDVIVANGEVSDRIGYPNEKLYTNPKELLSEIGWHMTWVSCLIYSEHFIKDAYFKRYYNTYFLQTGIIFEYFVNNACRVLSLPQVKVDNFLVEKHNSWQRSFFKVFGQQWYELVMSLPALYKIETKRKCLTDNSIKSTLFTYGNLWNYRERGFIDFTKYRESKFYIQQVVPYPAWIVGSICLLPRKCMTGRLHYFLFRGRTSRLIRSKLVKKILGITYNL